MTCKHRWYRNFMLLDVIGKGTHPSGRAAEHLCLDCGEREWEVLTRKEYEVRFKAQYGREPYKAIAV